MRIEYVSNSEEFSGVGQRAEQIRRRLPKVGLEIVDWRLDGVKGELRRNDRVQKRIQPWPKVFGSKSVNWVRLGKYVDTDQESVVHLTNQSVSFLARRLSPSIVTVHDIIEVTDPQDPRAALLNRYLYSGIREADRVIAVSEYVKQEVMKHYGVAEEKIVVIHNGVDRKVFYPLEGIRRDVRKILYVGSEHPRKNLRIALEVIAKLRKEMPKIQMVKVGAAGLERGRRETERLVDELGIKDSIVWREGISSMELNRLYNEAGALLFPSREEGFGLPVLEAMAVGCPVVCSNATSLPEVAGEAALLHDPDDVDGMVSSVRQLMNNAQLREEMQQKGFARVANFSWDVAAEKVQEVYKGLGYQ